MKELGRVIVFQSGPFVSERVYREGHVDSVPGVKNVIGLTGPENWSLEVRYASNYQMPEDHIGNNHVPLLNEDS